MVLHDSNNSLDKNKRIFKVLILLVMVTWQLGSDLEKERKLHVDFRNNYHYVLR